MSSPTYGAERSARAGCRVASLLLLALPAAAAAGENALTLGFSQLQYQSFERGSRIFQVAELSYQRPAAAQGPWHGLLLGAGLRAGPPTNDTPVPIEGFIQAQLTARLGPWEPAVGPEIGFSGLARLAQNTFLPLGALYRQSSAFLGPGYLAFTAAPLRFAIGMFRVSAAELFLGTGAFPFGTAVRVQVNALKVGIVL